MREWNPGERGHSIRGRHLTKSAFEVHTPRQIEPIVSFDSYLSKETPLKPRVLFVDDDPMILASLRRQILMKLPDLELVFFDSAAKAISFLEESSPAPSIVFSDVRMPEIDGPAFLAKIAAHHPCTVRFALTGQSEAEQLAQTFQVAHQVLSKPMDSAKLLNLIKSTLLFQTSLNGAPIEPHLVQILEGQGSFANLTEVFAMIRAEDVSLDSIAKRIEKDLTLKARLLGVANSAFVSPSRPVTTVLGAISLLGLRVVGAIYSGHMMQAKLAKDPPVQSEARRSLDYGTRLAVELQRAAHQLSLPDDLLDKAFLAATYFSFGRVLFATFGGREYREIREQSCDESLELEQQEIERFGISQEVAGAYKLFLWGLDAETCLAIANLTHQSPGSAAVREAIDVARARVSDLK